MDPFKMVHLLVDDVQHVHNGIGPGVCCENKRRP